MKEIKEPDGSTTFEMTELERQKLLTVTAIPLFLTEEVGEKFILHLPDSRVGIFLSNAFKQKASEVGIEIE